MFFFCPDGITPNYGLTGLNNTHIHTRKYVRVLYSIAAYKKKKCLRLFKNNFFINEVHEQRN